MGHKRMATSESLGRPPSVGSWLCAGKNSRVSHSTVKEGLFRVEVYKNVGHLRRQERPKRQQSVGLSEFIGVGNYMANE